MIGSEHQPGNLTMAKIKNMLKLEELFHSKYLSVELLHELISLYTCSIESTDEHQSELKFYFLEKIQFVLSRPENQVLLERASGANPIAESLRETLRSTARLDLPLPSMKKAQRKLVQYDGEHPDEKKKVIDMQLQILEQTKQDMDSLARQAQQVSERTRIEQHKISEIARGQNESLQARLALRKKARLPKKSLEAEDLQAPTELINKAELLRAQEEIRDAVVRMTLGITRREMLRKIEEGGRELPKGRVKTINPFDDDD